MALFYAEKTAKKSTKSSACSRFLIQSLDYQGFGVAKQNGKTWFVKNALPNELVEARIIEEKRQYGQAQAVKILQKSAMRQIPFCRLFERCGGCQSQHIDLSLQRETKQQVLFQRLQRLQSLPITLQPMLNGADRGYRRRAKLSIMLQQNKPVLGFRQWQSQQIMAVEECAILTSALSALLPKLQVLFNDWKQPKLLGHLELVEADNGVVLLLRHIGQLHQQDQQRLLNFADRENLLLFVMTDKECIEQWRGDEPYYQVNGLQLAFSVRDFIQVNQELNLQMIATALDWLALSSTDRILDLFCGVGNFTLPIAMQAQQVVGIEGVDAMVLQAKANAERNQLSNVEFYQADLDQPFVDKDWAKQPFNKVLLDPARNGAWFVLEHLCQLSPEKIVYVSCNPATLVRDAEKLLERGYRLEKCAMIDMFPHTAHLESISLFVKV